MKVLEKIKRNRKYFLNILFGSIIFSAIIVFISAYIFDKKVENIKNVIVSSDRNKVKEIFDKLSKKEQYFLFTKINEEYYSNVVEGEFFIAYEKGYPYRNRGSFKTFDNDKDRIEFFFNEYLFLNNYATVTIEEKLELNKILTIEQKEKILKYVIENRIFRNYLKNEEFIKELIKQYPAASEEVRKIKRKKKNEDFLKSLKE